jgi:peptide/nickel transport system permease protein
MALVDTVRVFRSGPRQIRGIADPRKHPMAFAGLVLLALYVLVALVGPMFVGDPLRTSAADALTGPNASHLLGTDRFGRDVLARAVIGTRMDLAVGVVIAVSAATVGSLVGVVAGYAGGIVDEIIMRVTDIILAFPAFVLALIIVAVLGDGVPNVVVAVAVAYSPYFVRLTRARALAEREREYVDAATLSGNRRWRIALRHVLPNSLGPAYTQATLVAGWAILDVAGLAFLGVGIQPPTAEWGVMVAEGANDVLTGAWWTALVPGGLIVILALAFQMVGDDLQGSPR